MQLSIVEPGYWAQEAPVVALAQVGGVHMAALVPPPPLVPGSGQPKLVCTVAHVLPAASVTIA